MRRVDRISGESHVSGSFWSRDPKDLLTELRCDATGLTSTEAGRRLDVIGPNRIGADRHASTTTLLVRQFGNPIVLLLIAATVLSLFLGDEVNAAIVLVIVLASAGMGFVQERSAVNAIRALLATVQVHADVIRDGTEMEIRIDDVVPGDLIVLRAGDVVPADCIVLSADALTVDESALTGESQPVVKTPGTTSEHAPVARRTNCVHLGTHVQSGTGRAIAVTTGAATHMGSIGTRLETTEPPTSFERGLRSFGYLLMQVGAAIVIAVFVVNILLDRPILDSVLFSLALAVGITPQLLPAIVTLTLSRGARHMAREDVIVKRLSSIEDFGGMDTLCVDKTGTLTVGGVRLDGALDLEGSRSDDVASMAWLNAFHQQGFVNSMDSAILASTHQPTDPGRRIDEIAYDFRRKRLSLAVDLPDGPMMITKGALANITAISSSARLGDGRIVPFTSVETDVAALYESLSSNGFRVLGLAVKSLSRTTQDITLADEADMTLIGLLTFADPPKAGVRETVTALSNMGIGVRMISGDNRFAARHIADHVGLDTTRMLVGGDIESLDDHQLADTIDDVFVFAEIEPLQKERLIRALRSIGRSVGFLGDGINDALALRTADVGISVDTAVDVAKESASIVLLDKNLDVIVDGVRRGRQCFANTLKYVFVTTSANFGNMISMAGATVLLPFLPLLPRQILLLNFLSDVPGMTIANDAVDAEQLDKPSKWDIRFVRNFMIVFGLVSTVFDYVTFAVLRLLFDANPEVFRTSWFTVSVGTELLVMLALRTRRPFIKSRPGTGLLISSVVVAAIVVTLPYSVIGPDLGFRDLSPAIFAATVLILVAYVIATESAKRAFFGRIDHRRHPTMEVEDRHGEQPRHGA